MDTAILVVLAVVVVVFSCTYTLSKIDVLVTVVGSMTLVIFGVGNVNVENDDDDDNVESVEAVVSRMNSLVALYVAPVSINTVVLLSSSSSSSLS